MDKGGRRGEKVRVCVCLGERLVRPVRCAARYEHESSVPREIGKATKMNAGRDRSRSRCSEITI
eukprot:1806222-Pleurochrysis_carterae.AAC.1